MLSSSTTRLSKVHPELKRRVERLVELLAERGVTVEVVQGFRTFAEQEALFAQGRTKRGKRVTNARGGRSNHNYGLAVDLCVYNDGQPDWNDEAGFAAIGPAAREVGLAWGGNWKRFKDRPHVELPTGLSVGDCYAMYQAAGGLQTVWELASKRLKNTEVVTIFTKHREPTDDKHAEDAPAHLPEMPRLADVPLPHEQIDFMDSAPESGASAFAAPAPPSFQDVAGVNAGAAPPQAVEGGRVEDAPVPVSSGIWSRVYGLLGGAAGALAAAKGFLSENTLLIVLGAVGVLVIVLVLIFRNFLMDWLRMQIAADPHRQNVR